MMVKVKITKNQINLKLTWNQFNKLTGHGYFGIRIIILGNSSNALSAAFLSNPIKFIRIMEKKMIIDTQI